jgi:hypothetical protein
MGLKLVLVIALLGAAALDWLAVSAEQDAKSLDWLKDDDSLLKPEEVEEILAKLDAKRRTIDDDELIDELLNLKKRSPCSLRSQESLVDACYVVHKRSLKNYCDKQVNYYSILCFDNPGLILEENFNTYSTSENVKMLKQATDEAIRRGWGLDAFIKQWVTEFDVVGQSKFYTICKRFLDDIEKMEYFFEFDFSLVSGLPEYLEYANMHCKAIVNAITRAHKKNKLTLEDAKKLLKGSPSLERDAVAEILVRLDKDLKIDGARVGELLLSPNRNNVCELESQEQRVSSCKLIVTQSLRNYCEDLVERFKKQCQSVIYEWFPTYVNPQMKETAKKLYSVAAPKAYAEYEKGWRAGKIRAVDDLPPGLNVQPAFKRLVVQEKPDFVDSLARECTAFHELGRKIKELFEIDIMATGNWLRSRDYYFGYADQYCTIALKEAKEAKKAKEAAKRRHKSSWRMFS